MENNREVSALYWFDPIRTPLTKNQLWNAHKLALGPSIAAVVLSNVNRSISLGNLGQRDLTFSNFFDTGQNILRTLHFIHGNATEHMAIDVEDEMDKIEELVFDISASKHNAFNNTYCPLTEARLGLFPYVSFRCTYLSIAPKLTIMGESEIEISCAQMELPL